MICPDEDHDDVLHYMLELKIQSDAGAVESQPAPNARLKPSLVYAGLESANLELH